jgi:hypothetical protein
MRNRVLLIVSALLLVCTGSAFAQLPPETANVELSLNSWKPAPEITLQGVDFTGTLGIEDKRFNEYRVTLGQKHKLRFAYVPVKYAELGKLVTATVVFEGRTFTGTTPVNYEFKWDMYRFGYEWDFVRMSHGFVGVIAELKYNEVSATISNPATSASFEKVKVPVPTIGGIARGYLGDYFSLTGQFTGLKLDRTDFFGKFYDLDLYAQLNLTRNLAVQGGYRSVDVDYVIDEDSGTFRMKGPYLGGTLRF